MTTVPAKNIVLINRTYSESLFYMDEENNYRFNHDIDEEELNADLIIIEVPTFVTPDKMSFDKDEFSNYTSLTIFIDKFDASVIANYTRQS